MAMQKCWFLKYVVGNLTMFMRMTTERFESPDSLKCRATGLRRLLGGLRAEAERSNDTRLTDKELRVLEEAEVLSLTLALRLDGAGKERKKLLDARGRWR